MAQSKDRSKKYHESLFVMLKNAASIDGIEPAEEVPDSIMRIFNSESKAKAEQELLTQYEALGHEEVSFAVGLATSLYEGKVNWTNDETSKRHFDARSCSFPRYAARTRKRYE